MTDIELFRRFPEARSIPHVELGDLPTPVRPMKTAGAELGIDELWVKRDDLTGEAYGGNKVRKLEFLLADALQKGHEEVWTVGAIGSNHVLATCIYAREVGLDCGALHFPQPVTEHVLDNLRALSTTHPDLTLVGHPKMIPMEMLKVKLREWLSTNPGVYYIPTGGSSPVGVLGYVNAALELARQIEAGEVPRPDYVVVAAGTCGTLAGLLLGFRMARVDVEVLGIRVVDRVIANGHVVQRLVRKTAELLEDAGVRDVPRVNARDVQIISDYYGEDYGVPTAEGLNAIDLFERAEGLHLEPTYTGKAAAGLIGMRAQFSRERANVLYWHTLSGADLSERIAGADVDSDLPSDYMDFFEQEFEQEGDDTTT